MLFQVSMMCTALPPFSWKSAKYDLWPINRHTSNVYIFLNCWLTQFSESGHHVNKSRNTLAEGLWQVGSKMVPQCEQVVRQVHAVVVLDSSKVGKLE